MPGALLDPSCHPEGVRVAPQDGLWPRERVTRAALWHTASKALMGQSAHTQRVAARQRPTQTPHVSSVAVDEREG